MASQPSADEPTRIGIIGAGVISAQYFATVERMPELRLVAVADKFPEAAERAVERLEGRLGEVAALGVDELLARDDIDVVVNLTIPAAHAEVSEAILRSGKHVYVEKPLALDTAQGASVLALAAELGLQVGCAPDTVLGTGIQTARRLVEAGAVGAPIAATAFMTSPGHERWHPNPDFYYQPGGGALFDMGPYYLTSLVHLLGPVESVVAMTSRSRDERTIATGARAGQTVPVAVDTHETALLRHTSGVISTIMMSFDVENANLPYIEVYGSEGTISVPDPNHFEGEVRISTREKADWTKVPVGAGAAFGRGYGVAELGRAVSEGRTPRASGELGQHLLEIIEGVGRSSREGVAVAVESRPQIPALVPLER